MSKIIPFPALLPAKKLASKIVCPPYDVIDRNKARKIAGKNPYSLLHVTKAEIDLPDSVDEYDPRVYERARLNFCEFMEKSWLVHDDASLYIYRMEMDGRVQTGVVCGVSVDEYDSLRIKRHEKTRLAKEDDRTKLSLTLGAHAEPVLLIFRVVGTIKEMILSETKAEPLFEITDAQKIRHTLWRAENCANLQQAFAEVDSFYIADGHHRSATASRVRKIRQSANSEHKGNELYNYFPAVVFPHDEVSVYRYDWSGDPKKRPPADVTIEDIMKLADHGGIMPPKSTWFAPKLSSGLFVYAFE